MPFYEYECSNCKFYTEVMQKISDAPLTKCPSCGKSALVKLVSAPNFRLKGGGWYETDFKGDKENKRNLAGAEREESSGSEPKADATAKTETPKTETAASSESKPASAPVSTSSSSDGGGSGRSRSARPVSKPAERTPVAKAKVAAKKGKAAPTRSKAKPAAKKKARR
jgi:putative FmdB family regulatory protein